MLPIASLMGALLALGNLARSMELIVVRAAGVSVFRIGGWVAIAGLALMLITGFLGEVIGPPMEQYAREMKTFEKYHDYSMAGNRSAWAKDGNTIIAIQPQAAAKTYGGIFIFKFDPHRRLQSFAQADSAAVADRHHWNLRAYQESQFQENRVFRAKNPMRLSTLVLPQNSWGWRFSSPTRCPPLRWLPTSNT